jgi:hypothetical protein
MTTKSVFACCLFGFSTLTPVYGVMLEFDNGNSGSDQFKVSDANPTPSVQYSFANNTGSGASFGVIGWSASRTGSPGVPLTWSISYFGGGVVASGTIPAATFTSGFKDIALDFRPTPGSIPTGATTIFVCSLSAPGHAAGTSYDFKYSLSSTAVFEVPVSGTIVKTAYTGGIVTAVDFTNATVPEPAATSLVAATGILGAALWRRHAQRAN